MVTLPAVCTTAYVDADNTRVLGAAGAPGGPGGTGGAGGVGVEPGGGVGAVPVADPPPQALKASTVRIIRVHGLKLRKNSIRVARVDSLTHF